MNKNYKAELDEAAQDLEKQTNLDWHKKGHDIASAFKSGADFAFNYQQAKIDKLVEALKIINSHQNCKDSFEICKAALAQLEKDGE